MWSGNMFWTSKNKPKPGTRFLVSYGTKNVVIVMGYETGPRSPKYIGGLQPEVHYALGTNGSSKFKVARLVDQEIPLGPVHCI